MTLVRKIIPFKVYHDSRQFMLPNIWRFQLSQNLQRLPAKNRDTYSSNSTLLLNNILMFSLLWWFSTSSSDGWSLALRKSSNNVVPSFISRYESLPSLRIRSVTLKDRWRDREKCTHLETEVGNRAIHNLHKDADVVSTAHNSVCNDREGTHRHT